ncbi:tRNA dihydrouridine synthase [Psychrobacter sp. I-STPA6b]|uniref:tRNA dihydrouridine synthase n=1 Tax=Psychrobacter sp. I-STPA6b TaxID=2585718 RepID=UPI001D0CD10B|nr:tRNA-dihydrouridine synthase family protein [Psychrobacter sp. I-STPA6b]
MIVSTPNNSNISTLFSHPVRLLAPMEGLTDPLMRQVLTQIATDLGRPYDWCVSEFIRVTQHVLPAHVFYKYVPELYTASKTSSGTPIHIQLLGSDPILLAETAQVACDLGTVAIDLNFGCPAKTVNNHRGGSVLLDEPSLIRDIINAVRLAVPSQIPVSAKIRLGYTDSNNMNDIRQAIADSGADWLTIHARTKTQGYKPPAYWEKIANFSQLAIPIIANGEIWNPAHATQCINQANTPHLMLGRGAVTRPDLIAQIDDSNIELSWQQLVPYQIAFLQGDAKNDKVLIGRYKQWLGMLSKGYPEAHILWEQIKREKQLKYIIDILQSNLEPVKQPSSL